MLRFKSSRKVVLLPWLVAALGFGPMWASASQDNQGDINRESQRVAQSSQFSDEQIESFIDARERVQEVSAGWRERLNNAESQEKLNSLRREVQEELAEAVRDEGLTVNEYNMMVEATQTNPELQNRVREMMVQ